MLRNSSTKKKMQETLHQELHFLCLWTWSCFCFWSTTRQTGPCGYPRTSKQPQMEEVLRTQWLSQELCLLLGWLRKGDLCGEHYISIHSFRPQHLQKLKQPLLLLCSLLWAETLALTQMIFRNKPAVKTHFHLSYTCSKQSIRTEVCLAETGVIRSTE